MLLSTYLTKKYILFQISAKGGLLMDIVKKCGQRLIEIRKKNNLSQADFSKRIGISRNTLSGYELGTRSPDISTLHKISLEFNVSLDYLLGFTNIETNDIDVKTICEKTNLSEEAIENIIKFNFLSEIISKILSSHNFWEIVCSASFIKDFSEIIYNEPDLKQIQTSDFETLFETLVVNNSNDKNFKDVYERFLDITSKIETHRYSISKNIEKISDLFDFREQNIENK